jgi:hypothetical protein
MQDIGVECPCPLKGSEGGFVKTFPMMLVVVLAQRP